MTTPSAAAEPSRRVDWIRAGQDVLREHGAVGLKLHAVAKHRGASTGSFYHHFESWAGYLDELAEYYSTLDPRAGFEAVAAFAPQDRLRALFELTKRHDVQPLDNAMRNWAATNERAATAVKKLDEEFLLFLRQLFMDLGLTKSAAQTRAVLAYSASAANIYSPWPITDADAERAVRFLTQPGPVETAPGPAKRRSKSVCAAHPGEGED